MEILRLYTPLELLCYDGARLAQFVAESDDDWKDADEKEGVDAKMTENRDVQTTYSDSINGPIRCPFSLTDLPLGLKK